LLNLFFHLPIFKAGNPDAWGARRAFNGSTKAEAQQAQDATGTTGDFQIGTITSSCIHSTHLSAFAAMLEEQA